MSVEVLPFELSFQRPFTVEVARTLTIRNTGSSPVAFKVKTTAPKQYCVRPNAGRIEPGQDFDVSVLLQAMKTEPPLDAKCRDKFLVQSAAITPDKEFASIASVLDSTEKSKVQERKIRVNWQAAGEDPASLAPAAAVTPSKPSLTNGASETPEPSRNFSSPSANLESSQADLRSVESHDDDNVSEAPKSVVSSAAATVSNAAQLTYEELKAKLAQAETQIASLKDSGLRQRNVKGSPESNPKPAPTLAQANRPPASGVPVPIVALLCLISFLLAYFFF
ncbi:PapD-like protein [Stachybotrys elegans]|uniref:PapD-like protein n=1 Tax=Stachybotrys elegans TaxID=80388 RepID=A0A8K0SYM5_9HYPO|nr:PapD-like protein [Stachybotrys elegans]